MEPRATDQVEDLDRPWPVAAMVDLRHFRDKFFGPVFLLYNHSYYIIISRLSFVDPEA